MSGFRSRSRRYVQKEEEQARERSARQQSAQRAAAERPDVDAARLAAFDVLTQVRVDDAYANLVLPKMLRDRGIRGRDAAFATEITYGTLRNLGVLDAVIDVASTRPLDRIDPQLLDALRLGAYQVLYTRVEPHAAVDTTVRLTTEKLKGFANAVMRTLTRSSRESWFEQATPPGEIPALAFRHSHPEWIAESFARTIGIEELGEALEADSERPKVHLAARPGEMSAEELALITGGQEGKYSPYAVYLDGGDPGELEPVREGLAAVQDEGSQLIARAVAEAPLSGEDTGRWLDLCAGPGGKAALLAALARIDGAHVDAVEIAPHRARLVENLTRGLPVTVHIADGKQSGLEPGFDRVLVDAPCSGLGALRRRPEARWRKQESDIAELSVLQFELLSAAYELVRPGGIVVYSTCSPDLRETREVVDRAVADLGATELDAHPLVLGMERVGTEKSVQMWPHRHGTDAMFFAVLQKPVT
ncbi:RsmB/NOP family class I SAM-dependent RNA methyltransferase [Corynebacterium sp.]|uniref:RsmB/NOP family class I SAM-dependent RNA methyltransferase n=1 Tax=Corynebacterium sp. TaxID=1720 RepID=UPI0026DCD553|nr:transcription antitermination factor NusB [Corynebacterium sp.]MDO5077496.1 transcription antitermination factor NusB [Corynebacterium sp.]